MTKKTYYKEGDKCDRCRNEVILGKAHRIISSGRLLCVKCYMKEERIRDYRIGNLDPKSNLGRGYIGEQITCKTRGINNQNIDSDNFKSDIDHTIDSEYGIVQTKCFSYQKLDRYWYVRVDNEHNKEFDFLIIHCMSTDMQILERTYIIPWEEVMRRSSIGIAKSSKTIGWYEQYRIDEKPYNDVYRNLKLEDCPALRNDNNVEFVYELFKE